MAENEKSEKSDEEKMFSGGSRLRSKGNASGNKKNIAFIVVIVLLAGLSIFFFVQYQDARDNPTAKSTAAKAEKDTKDAVSRVGKLMNLPKGETPVLATVQDKEKLNDQPFFDAAKNGDQLLIYSAAKQAIIYRESTNKIINVGPIAIDAQAPETTVPEPAVTTTTRKR